MERYSHQGRLSKKATRKKVSKVKKNSHQGRWSKKATRQKISKVKKNSHQGLPLSLVEELLEGLLELVAVGRWSS